MIIPNHLSRGDTIGIVTPSGNLRRERRQKFYKGVRYLENLGFRVKLSKHALKEDASAEEKGEDINAIFSDLEIKAIICSKGGDYAEKVLPFIDWNIIKENPKIFMGISDITVFLNAIMQKTVLITFHGNDLVYGFGTNPSEYSTNEFLERLVKRKIGKVKPNFERRCVREGIGQGKLIGGNIRCLLKLVNTGYWPGFSDSVLLIEAYQISHEECNTFFKKFKEKGIFDKLGGAVVGHVYSLQSSNNLKQMEDILFDVTRSYDLPILKISDFGHCVPNTTLPIGGYARVNATDKELEIIGKCVV